MRRIALITPILPVPLDPTRGRFVYETARSLSRIATVRAYLAQPSRAAVGLLPGRNRSIETVEDGYRLEGLDVEAFTYPAVPLLSRAVNGYACAHALVPRLRLFQPDLVLAYWIYPDGFGALRAARRLAVPAVLGALGTDVLLRKGISAWHTRRALREADGVIVVSQHMAKVVERDYGADPGKTHTVINGFNRAVFYPRLRTEARAQVGVAENVRLIIYVGRLVEAKGLFELLEAVKLLAAQGTAVSLALIGNGSLRSALESRIAELKISHHVTLLGGLPPPSVATWIAASDLLTLPSWSEGYPNVVVEAIACGRPVVASDVGGVGEIITPSNGILVQPRSVRSLTEGLKEAFQVSWDHAAIAAPMRRSWDDVAVETLAICDRVLSARSVERTRPR